MSEIGIVGVLLDRLKELGWRESTSCPRYVRESIFIDDLFKASFKRLNEKALNASGLSNRIDKVFDRVKDLLENAEPHVFLEYLRRGIDIEEDKKKVRVWLLDYDNVDNNDFTVCREVQFYGEHMDIRPDFILYVNGIPLVVVEAKDPSRLGERAVEEGVAQLLRYEAEAPWLFKYVQLGVVYVGDEDSVYMPMLGDWRGRERSHNKWRSENGEYNIIDLLRRERILDLIKWFIFYKGIDKKRKIVPRYNQYWATIEAVKKIRGYLRGEHDLKRGLIWHWQGSGKTYIMFYIAYQFYQRFIEQDPIVFFIVDRRELQKQLYEDFIKDLYAPYFQEEIKVVESIEELKKILREIKESETRGTIVRGVYVVLIQKFQPKEFMDLDPIEKKEILLLLDEAHRSQYGELGATINRVLPNAIRLAFTGTPVMSYERNTFAHFAYPERGELYLHKYFISDSIKDGYTVPLKYQVVQEINGIKINVAPEEIRDVLETWAKNAVEIGSIDDLVEEEEEPVVVTKREIRQRINKIKVFLENKERIKHIAEYIADRIIQDTENFTFKAMVVVASRLACVRMKRALDEALTKRYGDGAKKWSEVVMIYTNDDKEEIRSYLEELLSRWRGSHGLRDWQEVNRLIQDKFKEEEDPRILIVTDMLITGFDCPRLKVMYLDKPLYEHRLLQAIARVNRPFKEGEAVKEFGLIIDFVGLLEQVKETIKKYELLDSETYEKIYVESIQAIDKGLEELRELVNEVKAELRNGVNVGNHGFTLDIDRVIELLEEGRDKEAVTELEKAARMLVMGYSIGELRVLDLIAKIRRIVNLYRALGSHPGKLELKNHVVVLGKLYNLFTLKRRGKGVSQEFWDRLIEMIHEKTVIPGIELVEEFTIEPLSIEELSKELDSVDSHSPISIYITADVLSTIRGFLDSEPANPVYKFIYERLKKLEEEWARRVDINVVNELKSMLNELNIYLKMRRGMRLHERISYDVRESLAKRFNIKVSKLNKFEEVLPKIVSRYESAGRQIREIRGGDRVKL
ncbi:MAG: HsdR family type I site-specific deoxyribonuclease, partial [Ignisphaera sp.]|nr:HsdR family type I site-specific deoxyribonuclease [Ignisphaera sp.]